MYKIEFFCFNGIPKYFWVIYDDKTKQTTADFYTVDGGKLDMQSHYPNSDKSFTLPSDYQEIVDAAKCLADDFPFVRVDFFKTADSWLFSEMTFYHWAGLMPFSPAKYDLVFGSHITLPKPILE